MTAGEQEKQKKQKVESSEAYEKRKEYCRERRDILHLSTAAALDDQVALTEKQKFFRDSSEIQLCIGWPSQVVDISLPAHTHPTPLSPEPLGQGRL